MSEEPEALALAESWIRCPPTFDSPYNDSIAMLARAFIAQNAEIERLTAHSNRYGLALAALKQSDVERDQLRAALRAAADRVAGAARDGDPQVAEWLKLAEGK